MAPPADEGHRTSCDESRRGQKSSPINRSWTIAHLDAMGASIDDHAAQNTIRLVDLCGSFINGSLPPRIEGLAENDYPPARHTNFGCDSGVRPLHDTDVIGGGARIQLRNHILADEDLAPEIR